MNRFWVLSILSSIIILGFAGIPPDAFAISGTISDKNSCQSFGLSWQLPNVCTTDSSVIVDSGDTLQIDSNVIFKVSDIISSNIIINYGTIEGNINNSGILNNYGDIFSNNSINNSATVNNYGLIWSAEIISNSGKIDNFGIFDNQNIIKNSGTINNSGTMRNFSNSLDEASIDNFGSINNNCGATIVPIDGIVSENPIQEVPCSDSLPPTEAGSSDQTSQKVPNWVKNTMGWFADGLISEDEIISAIQFLINEGIIKID